LEPSKKERIRPSLEDLPILGEVTLRLLDVIIRNPPKEVSIQNEWDRGFADGPKHLVIEFSDKEKNFRSEFELILSELGSLTLRPREGKITPIFYISLAKTGVGEFVWETGEGKEVSEDEIWVQMIRSIYHWRQES
jgi:hypothetical protein